MLKFLFLRGGSQSSKFSQFQMFPKLGPREGGSSNFQSFPNSKKDQIFLGGVFFFFFLNASLIWIWGNTWQFGTTVPHLNKLYILILILALIPPLDFSHKSEHFFLSAFLNLSTNMLMLQLLTSKTKILIQNLWMFDFQNIFPYESLLEIWTMKSLQPIWLNAINLTFYFSAFSSQF